ncbi:MAG: HAMP domain-containing protein [Bacteroidales bacterium]|nr:HAMP domain-containing protein [Bacteroidales bacterium]
MKIKTKLTLSFLILLVVIFVTAGIAAYYLERLGNETKAIMKDNYRTVTYMDGIADELDGLLILNAGNKVNGTEQIRVIFQKTDSIMTLQMANITEQGEAELSKRLKSGLQTLEKKWLNIIHSVDLTANREELISDLENIMQEVGTIRSLNSETMYKRSLYAGEIADRVLLYMAIFGLVGIVIGLFFLIVLPPYLTKPINNIMEGIRQISRRNYKYKLETTATDEFGALASAFNSMATKLDEFENSSVAEVIKTQKRTEAVINHMHEAIICLDENLRLLFLNDNAYRLLGLENDEVSDKHISDLVNKSNLLSSLYSEIMVGSYKENEFKPATVAINGKELVFSREIIPISTRPTGETHIVNFGFVIVLHDITQLLAKDKAKTLFIATLSHELKTPLSSIGMSADLLKDEKLGALNPEQMELIVTIRQNHDRINRKITEMLEIAKIENDHVALEILPVQPVSIIEKALAGVEIQLKEKGLKIEKRLQETMPDILADSDKTLWILNNFLTNAIRYSPEKGNIIIESKVINSHVLISVTDQGPGIHPENSHKLFEKYNPPDREGGIGTGLGLAISKKFIDAMGGNIGVNNESGKGARFWISIPRFQ